jgi:hypothetical protein
MNTTTHPDLIKIDWIELDLGAIIDRYGWASTLNGLKNLLPPGETLATMIESINDQQESDLCEEQQYTEWSDRDGYRSDCF